MKISELKPTLNVKTINKNTMQVISSTPTTASVTSSQYIFFSISTSIALLQSFETYKSIKIRFRQLSSNNEGLVLSKANSNYMITSDTYIAKCINENIISRN